MGTKKVSAIILAAGSSSRMGRAKFTLKLPDGKTFLENICEQYADFGCEQIIVVLNKAGMMEIKKNPQNLPAKTTVVMNPHPEAGRFGSIQCGFQNLKPKVPVFIHNVDNPYAKKETLELLLEGLMNFDMAKPAFQGKRGHPVLVNQKIAKSALKEKEAKMVFRDFLKQFDATEIEVFDASILWNINDRENLEMLSGKA